MFSQSCCSKMEMDCIFPLAPSPSSPLPPPTPPPPPPSPYLLSVAAALYCHGNKILWWITRVAWFNCFPSSAQSVPSCVDCVDGVQPLCAPLEMCPPEQVLSTVMYLNVPMKMFLFGQVLNIVMYLNVPMTMFLFGQVLNIVMYLNVPMKMFQFGQVLNIVMYLNVPVKMFLFGQVLSIVMYLNVPMKMFLFGKAVSIVLYLNELVPLLCRWSTASSTPKPSPWVSCTVALTRCRMNGPMVCTAAHSLCCLSTVRTVQHPVLLTGCFTMKRWTIFLERTKEGHRQSVKRRNCFKGNAGETSERWGWEHMGFSDRVDTILNWTKLNYFTFLRHTTFFSLYIVFQFSPHKMDAVLEVEWYSPF